MKRMGKIIGSSFCSLLLLLGLILPVQTAVPVLQSMTVAADSLSGHLPQNGLVKGDGVYGYTTDYVCNGGEQEIEHAVQNGWHITLENYYYSHGVEWYQCWDTDDGDYYGWIDRKYITLSWDNNNNSSSGNTPVTVTSISPRKGQVAGNGVYGYASSYACYSDGKQQTQHAVENTWHITAKNTCYSHGVTWYECWDTDDGDYYGWIDANYLSFYDTTPAQTQAPKQTVVVEKTVLVTEAPKPQQTVVVEKTVLVTEPPTETVILENTVLITETKEKSTEAVAAVNLDGSSNHDNNNSSDDNRSSMLGLILIGAGILILMGMAGTLITMLVKKSKEKPTGNVQFHNPWEESDSPMNPYAGQNPSDNQSTVYSGNPSGTMYGGGTVHKNNSGFLTCPNCGAVSNDPTSKFCEQCGARLQ